MANVLIFKLLAHSVRNATGIIFGENMRGHKGKVV
jgi:hypothetical protein